MKIRILKATDDDVVQTTLVLEQARKFKESMDDLAWSEAPFTDSEIAASIAMGNTYSIFVDNILAGTFVLLLQDDATWGRAGNDQLAIYIHRFAISDLFRGKNIGAYVFTWCTEFALQNDKKYIRLDIPSQNVGLKKYYSKFSFEEIRATEHQSLLMQKTL